MYRDPVKSGKVPFKSGSFRLRCRWDGSLFDSRAGGQWKVERRNMLQMRFSWCHNSNTTTPRTLRVFTAEEEQMQGLAAFASFSIYPWIDDVSKEKLPLLHSCWSSGDMLVSYNRKLPTTSHTIMACLWWRIIEGISREKGMQKFVELHIGFAVVRRKWAPTVVR